MRVFRRNFFFGGAVGPTALIVLLFSVAFVFRGVGKAGVSRVDESYLMIAVAAGKFQMGSPENEKERDRDESPRHWVRISRPFLLGRTEVTQGLWRRVMGNNPSHFKACGKDCPVEGVSWDDALEFCNRLSLRESLDPCYTREGDKARLDSRCKGYRLPTEAEWEYAARAGGGKAFPNGPITAVNCEKDASLDELAWYCGNSSVNYEGCLSLARQGGPSCAGTHPVGEKSPNAWGLFDMHGNVWEWVWDRMGPYPAKEATDPLGFETGLQRVVRGGGWRAIVQNCRSANRRPNAPDYRMNVIGLRLARWTK